MTKANPPKKPTLDTSVMPRVKIPSPPHRSRSSSNTNFFATPNGVGVSHQSGDTTVTVATNGNNTQVHVGKKTTCTIL